MSVPQGTSLATAPPSAVRTGQTVWLETARVLDPRFGDAGANAALALTLSVKRYLEETGAFAAVKVLPGEPALSEQLLRFEFTKLSVRRETHPAYFPAAILTLTIYIWVNGPMFVDTTEVDATLIVLNPGHRELARFTAASSSRRNIGFADGGWVSGTTDRTAVVEQLIDQYLQSTGRTGVKGAP